MPCGRGVGRSGPGASRSVTWPPGTGVPTSGSGAHVRPSGPWRRSRGIGGPMRLGQPQGRACAPWSAPAEPRIRSSGSWRPDATPPI